MHIRTTPPQAKTNMCIWHSQQKRSHVHSTAECRQFYHTTPYNRWKVANQTRICKTCLIDAHPFSQCPMKDMHRRCDECGYTHNDIMGCCPAELSRIVVIEPPKPDLKTGRSPKVRQWLMEKCPWALVSDDSPWPDITVINKEPRVTLAKDVWFYDTPLPNELTSSPKAMTTDQGDGRPNQTKQEQPTPPRRPSDAISTSQKPVPRHPLRENNHERSILNGRMP